jgi:predicted ATPase
LQRLHPALVEQQPEVMALHLAEGGRPDEAVPFWLDAGKRSLARSALIEASRLLRRGLTALGRLPETVANLNLRLRLFALLGPAVFGVRGPGSAEAREIYNTAYTLAQDLREDVSHFPIYWGWWRTSVPGSIMRERSMQLLRGARRRGDPELMLQAHHCAWSSHYSCGELDRCLAHIEDGLALYEANDFRHHADLYGNHDAKVCAEGNKAQVLWQQGRLAQALHHIEQAKRWADELGHLGSRVHARDMSLLNQVFRRNFLGVYEQAGELVRVTADFGLQDARAKGLIFRGWATAMAEGGTSGPKMLEEGFAQQRDTGTDEDFQFYLSLWAEVLIAAGQPERAIEELRRGHDKFTEMGLGFWHSEVHRLLGQAILAADSSATRSAHLEFDEAAREARAQGAAMLGLRAAASAARLYLRQDRIGDGLAALTAARAAITEEDGGVDLREAATVAAMLRERL